MLAENSEAKSGKAYKIIKQVSVVIPENGFVIMRNEAVIL